MTGAETWIGVFLFGLFLPMGVVASNAFVIAAIGVLCLVVRTGHVYLFAPVLGTTVFVTLRSDMFFSGLLGTTAVFQWLAASALASLVLAFVVRWVLNRIGNRRIGA